MKFYKVCIVTAVCGIAYNEHNCTIMNLILKVFLMLAC